MINSKLSLFKYNIGSCDSGGRNCRSVDGLLAELMRILSVKFNFTWETFSAVDGKWGTRPLSGPANKSGTWGGVFGGVVNEDYDFSLSTWSLFIVFIKVKFFLLLFLLLFWSLSNRKGTLTYLYYQNKAFN